MKITRVGSTNDRSIPTRSKIDLKIIRVGSPDSKMSSTKIRASSRLGSTKIHLKRVHLTQKTTLMFPFKIRLRCVPLYILPRNWSFRVWYGFPFLFSCDKLYSSFSP